MAMLLALAFVWGVRVAAPRSTFVAALAAAVWMGVTLAAAASGVFRRWDATPPPFMFLVLAIIVLGLIVAFSPLGTRLSRGLPLAALVGIQGFRLPLELLMHDAYEAGVMPVQMSYSGRNLDILTGALALVVAALLVARRAPNALVWGWNLLGLGLLVNIVTVAILSTPRFQYFGPDQLNVWVTYPPFVWLPAVMVLAAWSGHLLVFRALRNRTPGGA